MDFLFLTPSKYAFLSPNTRKGLLKRSILFGVEPDGRSAVIGPAKSFVGLSMTAHEFGPASLETGRVVAYLDSLMGVLYTGLRALPGGDRINLIVTADHGMTDVSDERFVRIPDVLDTSLCARIVSTNPTTIFSKPGCRDRILEQLAKVEHISAWPSEAVPEHLHYGSSPRLGDIIVAPDLGWQFSFTPRGTLGAHGYDPEEPDMLVVFRAAGPDFKQGYVKADKFDNVDLYSLLARLLKVRPAPTDGSLEGVRDLLIIR